MIMVQIQLKEINLVKMNYYLLYFISYKNTNLLRLDFYFYLLNIACLCFNYKSKLLFKLFLRRSPQGHSKTSNLHLFLPIVSKYYLITNLILKLFFIFFKLLISVCRRLLIIKCQYYLNLKHFYIKNDLH